LFTTSPQLMLKNKGSGCLDCGCTRQLRLDANLMFAKETMEEAIHKYHDPAFTVDPNQWGFDRKVRRGRAIGIACAAVMAASLAGIVLSKGMLAILFAVLFFLAGGLPFVTGMFGWRPSCSGCGGAMRRDKKDDTFLICPQCRRFIWTGNRMDNLS